MKDFMKKKRLSREDYFQALSLTQLVSIDLLIFFQNKLLVGERSNNPAQGSLFVPGGKVYKNEYLSEGLERISTQEIGFPLHTSQLRLKGIYDHIYENNFQDDSCGTHYVRPMLALVYFRRFHHEPDNSTTFRYTLPEDNWQSLPDISKNIYRFNQP